MVTVTVRGGGGGGGAAEASLPPPPQPASSSAQASDSASRILSKSVFQRRRRPAGAAPSTAASGIQNRTAKAGTPNGEGNGEWRAAVGLVCTVSAEMSEPLPGVSEGGVSEQVPTAEEREQLSETGSLNEAPKWLTVTV